MTQGPMFESQKVDRIIILVLTVALAIVCYIVFSGKPALIDGGVIELRSDSIRAENQRLSVQVIAYKKHIDSLNKHIDSLQALKPQITKKYERKYKEIDDKHVVSVVNEFSGIFANNNIK